MLLVHAIQLQNHPQLLAMLAVLAVLVVFFQLLLLLSVANGIDRIDLSVTLFVLVIA
jgi:hypothetical protein